MNRLDLTQEELMAIVSYSEDTGLFTWRGNRGRYYRGGRVAGHKDSKGYICIGILGISYRAHRLAWLYVYGCWPEKQIDHINGERADNRISNLRDVGCELNSQNKLSAMKTSKSGLLGVYFDKSHKKWRAEIIANSRRHRLGRFDTAEEAHAAYLGAKAVLHPSSMLGSIAEKVKDVDEYGEGTLALGGTGKRILNHDIPN